MTQWFDFVASAASGAFVLICLAEGTRRWAAYGFHRTAVWMTAFGVIFCFAYSGFSYWKHLALRDMGQSNQNKIFTNELAADWGKDLSPVKREEASAALARLVFVESGKLRDYIDKVGERKRFSPTEEDIRNREVAVITQTRLADAARSNLGEAIVWLIWGAVAALFGVGVARDKAHFPVSRSEDGGARSSNTRGSP